MKATPGFTRTCHAAARRMTELARQHAARFPFAGGRRTSAEADALLDRALRQLARELLLAQASDWAFLMKTGTARNYATKRTRDHLLRFTRLYEQIRDGALDEAFLENCEWRDNLFPHLHWQYYA